MDGLKRLEALQHAALAVSSARGDRIFQELTRYLTAILHCELALIGEVSGSQVRTLGVHGVNGYVENFSYPLAITPCADVVGKSFMVIPEGVVARYPDDVQLAKFGAVGYAGYPLNDSDGRPVGVLAILAKKPLLNHALIESVLKIFAVRAEAELERNAHEAALAASAEQYRAIFNAAADSMVLRDAEFRVVDVNPAYEAMSGRKREEALGRSDLTMSPPELTARVRSMHERAIAGEKVMFEALARRKDGSRFDIETRGVPILHQGRPHVLYIGRDITARKSAEQVLRASEEQYRAIFNASTDAMVLRDAEFRIVDVNPAYLTLSGYARDEVVGATRLTLRVPESNLDRLDMHQRALGGEVLRLDTAAARKDGTRFHLEVSLVPMAYGGRPHVLYIGRDISERKRAEELLRASEEQYRAVFNATADALVLRDADFRIVDVNPAYEALSGYARSEVIGKDRVVANPPGMEAQLRALHKQALAGEPVIVETVRVRKDSNKRDVELRGVPIQHRGKPHVLYIGRDISERKRAEASLRASEEQYRAIFNAAADALVLRDAEARVVDVNPAFLEISGYTREEVLRANRWIFAGPDQAALAAEMHRRVIAGESVQFEVDGRRKNGSRFVVEMRAVPILYRGQPHALGMARDITQRKAMESRLRQAQRMEALGHLTGGVAHDFNNLLAAIMGYVVLASERESAAGDAKLTAHLDKALASCRQARDLIQQMLTFSRGQRGSPRPLALAEATAESLKLLRSSLPSSLEIETAFEQDPVAMLDPVQLDQILLNLSINARDAMSGHGRIEVQVRAAALREKAVCASCRKRFRGEFAELSVSDSGPGIAPEVLERMFEPFFTTKDVGRGSGMGLATVHGVVHECQGHILVESTPGAGSRFRILLPLQAGLSATGLPAPRAEKPAGRRKAPLSGRVLVVDDEKAVADFMRELLESWGLEAASLSSPLGVLERIAREAPDLVILDQSMPGITGMSLAREIAAARPGLPVLLYTGNSERLEKDEMDAAGVRALLHKPVEPDLLYGLLRTHLH